MTMLKHIVTVVICIGVSILIGLYVYYKNNAQEKRIDELTERYRRLEVALTRPNGQDELMTAMYRNARIAPRVDARTAGDTIDDGSAFDGSARDCEDDRYDTRRCSKNAKRVEPYANIYNATTFKAIIEADTATLDEQPIDDVYKHAIDSNARDNDNPTRVETP